MKIWKSRSANAVAVLLVSATCFQSPAGAVDVLAARGEIQVTSDFHACGTVTFDRPQAVITGNMLSTGWGTTNDTQENALIRDDQPILAMNTDSVTVCTEGLNFIRTPELALAQITLQASGPDGDTFVFKICGRTSVEGFRCRP